MKLTEVWIFATLTLFYFCKNINTLQRSKVFVICISGFRYDYVNEPGLEAIARFNEEGVVVPLVRPIYPAQTYPNLYSIATGLYAENHGIIGDIMYDQIRNDIYQPAVEQNATKITFWNKAEPIWTTAQKNGFKTALYWWPGCEIEIDGVHPSVCETHRHSDIMDYKMDPLKRLSIFRFDIVERIGDVIQMFKNNELDIAFLYYDLVEQFNFIFGPDSHLRKKAVRDIDGILLELMETLDKVHLEEEVNILLFSDSGVTNVNDKIRKYLDLNKFQQHIQLQLMFGSLSYLLPVRGKEDKLFMDLKHENFKGLNLFRKADIPIGFHIKESDRVFPILLQAQEGYFINPLKKDNSLDRDKRVKGPDYTKYNGMNGYNPYTELNMTTVFFAKGPAFKKGVISRSPLSTVDIYNVICRTLGMKGLPNNGSRENIQSIFLESNTTDNNENTATNIISTSYFLYTFIIMTIFLVFN